MKMNVMREVIRTLVLSLILVFTSWVEMFGHAMDQSYIYLSIYQNDVLGRFELNYKELNGSLGLNFEQGMSLDEIRPFLPQIREYIVERVQLTSEYGEHGFDFLFDEIRLIEQKQGTFLVLPFDLLNDQPMPDKISARYDLFFSDFPGHVGMLLISHHWEAGIVNNEAVPSLIFQEADKTAELSLTDISKWKGWWAMTKLGMWHIWIGLDHILFLLALALPAVVRRTVTDQGKWVWQPVKTFRSAFIYIITIVTFFTIAHSLTLSLAATGIVQLPARIIESIIALSIALAALHNIKPIFGHREWLIAFGFGLFHGLGFASVFGEKGLNGEFMFLSLFGFNIGVEIGQVAIILIIFPLLFFFRSRKWYNRFLYYGSILLILISLYWFIERIFEIDLILDNYIGKAWNKVF